MRMGKSKARRRGFTLIEIMVATVIMVILVGFFIKITTDVLKVWNRSVGKLSSSAEARIAMELITSDLENSLSRNNGQQWLRVQGPEKTGGEFNGNSVSLKLFSAAPDRLRSTLPVIANQQEPLLEIPSPVSCALLAII